MHETWEPCMQREPSPIMSHIPASILMQESREYFQQQIGSTRYPSYIFIHGLPFEGHSITPAFPCIPCILLYKCKITKLKLHHFTNNCLANRMNVKCN